MRVEISVGEFLDKLTILEIKSERIADSDKLKSIKKELSLLQGDWEKSEYRSMDLVDEISGLKKINETLWDIEDQIRDKERNRTFDQGFIDLARAVYINNDKRAEIKRAINIKTGSDLIEEKSYADY